MPPKFYAHTLPGRPKEEWQPLDAHLKAVAERARKFAEPFGAGEWAYATGFLHDIGKYSGVFQNKLLNSATNETNLESITGNIDHSSAGAQKANALFGQGLGLLIAYAIASHHSGLLDWISNGACLKKRLDKKVEDCSACPLSILSHPLKKEELPFSPDKNRVAFQIQFFVRMLFSCLIDADRLDAEAFTDTEKNSFRGKFLKLEQMHNILSRDLQMLVAAASPTTVNLHRKTILESCITASLGAPGFYSLTVPTGGGKTLSSLAFALKHAIKYNKQRIIYVIPYTSIIEQNADVFRHIFGNDVVLEHHCNYQLSDNNYTAQLATENWDAPLIVTTNVQFFESLFQSRTSACRKIHNIANSVIILDEAQMLPVPLLKPCMEALKELVTSYKATILLCSATQPAIGRSPVFSSGIENVQEIISNPDQLYQELQRVETKIIGSVADEVLGKRIIGYKQVLCIVNTRRNARELYEKIKDSVGAYHLSALMCPAHRSQTIQEIRKQLKDKKVCRVISTQLIEAGVDIDFPVVFRALAGIDSIAQAAGRCNREGNLQGKGEVFIFEPENGLPVGFLRQGGEVTQGIMRNYEDLLSLSAVKEYFLQLYWRNNDNLDKKQILDDFREGAAQAHFPFESVGNKFKLIDQGMESIVIPFNEEAKGLISVLRFGAPSKEILRKVQRYSVQVYPQVLNKLGIAALEMTKSGVYILINCDIYRHDIGLDCNDPVFRDAEKNIV